LEVANGLRFTLNDSEIGRKIFADFSRLPLEYFDLKPNQIKEILNLAYRVEATVYDTSYHFLARLLGGELLTCDREYFEKAQSLGSINFVK
jgi:predicted nucleic acid-binding protein